VCRILYFGKDIAMQCIECREQPANKESGLCHQCESLDEKKINGLLYLPAAGLVINMLISPFNAWEFISSIVGFMRQGMAITPFGIGGVALIVIDVVLTFLTGWYFFKRKRNIRKVIIPYYLFGLLYMLYFVALRVWLFGATLDTMDIRNALTPVVGALIWIPYFLFSKRIPRVFAQE